MEKLQQQNISWYSNILGVSKSNMRIPSWRFINMYTPFQIIRFQIINLFFEKEEGSEKDNKLQNIS